MSRWARERGADGGVSGHRLRDGGVGEGWHESIGRTVVLCSQLWIVGMI